MPAQMPYAAVSPHVEKSDEATALAMMSVKTEEHKMKLEEKRLDDSLESRQHQRNQEAREIEMRKFILEKKILNLQFAEDKQIREHEENRLRRKQELEKEMKELEMEENSKTRGHELQMKLETHETIKLKLESDKKKEDLKRLDLQRLRLQLADNRHARRHKEQMAAYAVESLKAAEEIRRQRVDERRIVTEENQAQISEMRNRCEELERQRQTKEEQDTQRLRNLGLFATGVGATSGAIGGALRTTAAVGIAAGMVGAATVLAPVSVAIATISGAGYVYKVTSSNRA